MAVIAPLRGLMIEEYGCYIQVGVCCLEGLDLDAAVINTALSWVYYGADSSATFYANDSQCQDDALPSLSLHCRVGFAVDMDEGSAFSFVFFLFSLSLHGVLIVAQRWPCMSTAFMRSTC